MTHSLDSHSQPIIEDLPNGVYLEWWYYRRLVIYRLKTNKPDDFRAQTDTLVETMIKTIAGWSPEQPYLAILDVNLMGFGVYGIRRFEALMESTPKTLVGRTATVIPNSPIGFLLNSAGERMTRNRFPHIKTRTFKALTEAITWVAEGLSKDV